MSQLPSSVEHRSSSSDERETVFHIERQDIEGQELFPLKMAALEKFMLWDDTERYPKRFRVAMQFQGSLNHDALNKAFQLALPRHPLLMAEPDRRDRPAFWQLPERKPIRLIRSLARFENQPETYSQHFDGHFEGCRFWVYDHNDVVEWVFDFHHACTDGRGARVFVIDLLRAYEAALSGADSFEHRSRIDTKALLHRDRYRRVEAANFRGSEQPLTRPTNAKEKLINAFHFHVLGPKPLAKSLPDSVANGADRKKQPTTNDTSNAMQYGRFQFNVDETNQLQAKLGEAKATWNDLGIALMFQTMSQWNRQHYGRLRGRLRIMVPIDLRTYEDRYQSAVNRFGFGFVVMPAAKCFSIQSTLASVQQQMARIQQLRLAIDFNDIFEGCQRSRFGEWMLRRLLPRMGCLATGVLTTMGDVTKRARRSHRQEDESPLIGGLKLESVVGIPPLRHRTSFAAGITLAAGTVSIATLFDGKQLGPQAPQLAECYERCWRVWLGGNEQ